jgi:hypothetical protein
MPNKTILNTEVNKSQFVQYGCSVQLDHVLYSGRPCGGATIWNDIGRNCLLGHRKKIAKCLMRIFTCCSSFLYGSLLPVGWKIVQILRKCRRKTTNIVPTTVSAIQTASQSTDQCTIIPTSLVISGNGKNKQLTLYTH